MRKKIPLVASLLVALVAHVLTAAINIRASHSTGRSSDLSSDLSDNSLIEQSIEQSIDPSIDQLIDPSNDPLPSVRLGYADIFTPEKLEFVNNTDNYEIPGCEARQIYLMSRHGTRTPGAGHLELQQEFLAKYKELQKKGKLSKVHRVFDDIHLSFTDAPAHSLTWLGAKELQTIAARYKRRYPRLFSKDAAHKGKIDVLSSDIQRAIDSGHNFLRGLFGKDDLLYESLASLMRFDNYTMRAFDRTCPKYIQLVKGNNNAFTEERTFASGEEMKKLVDKFIKTHSLDGMQDYITPSLLRALYVICSNEQTHKMNKNWCKAFTSEYFYPIGYSDELFCYNIFGPGHAENLLVAHPLFRDVVHNIEAFIYKDLYDPTAHVFTTNLRFGHLENLAPMLAVLDLFIPDEPLRADNYDAYVHKRKYTVFNYTPFAAEIAFVLHKCPIEGRDLMSQYKVHVLVNEQPVKMLNTGPLKCTQKKLPENRLVDDGSLCDFVHFKDQLLPFIDQTTEDACAYP